MGNATKRKAVRKPSKPYPDFPLFPHAARQWAKKIRGRVVYFGVWADPDAALQKYLDQRDDLHAGRTPRVKGDGLTMRELVNRFLTANKDKVSTGEIVPRTFHDYHDVCSRLIGAFGKDRLVDDLASDDFEHLKRSLAKTRGPVALGNEITRTRMVFKYAFDAGLIDRPVRYGPMFKQPSRRILRKVQNSNGPRMFEGDEIRALIDAAGLQLKAMILLGINCGFGNSDVARLPLKALDLDNGWVDYPRPKTGVQRRCPLWEETVEALRQALESRPKPNDKAHANLLFITSRGASWSKEMANNPVSSEFGKLQKRLGIYRKGRGFYSLRHSFATIGQQTLDKDAVRFIMGHTEAANDMLALYNEQRPSDDRLQKVSNYVHDWLFRE